MPSQTDGNVVVSQRLLDEQQNATFDTDYHTPEEMANKVAFLRQHFGGRPVTLLDAGGGNGVFCDAILELFPNWQATIVDVSDLLLGQNSPDPRKRLIKGSIFEIDHLFAGEKFDVISLNWILHHLVGNNYAASLENIRHALRLARGFLAPNGMICIGENRYQGVGGTNLPARLIYGLTSVETPSIARLVARHANTAGVGVCFQSEAAWLRLFSDVGLKEMYPRFVNRPFAITGLKKWGLLLKTAGKVHFYLGIAQS